ncbi:hypothetical protein ACL02S_23350 [Nocardia sp. 004]|uniref:hypothetical protein n=1 Tax=Nocardia sp. 004 TaxID=3385978 RepID=UPI0039A05077
MLNSRMAWSVCMAVIVTVVVAGCGAGSDSGSPEQTAAPPNTTAAPAQLVWDTFRGVRLPRSPIDGPRNSGDAVPTGYSRTPQGAVLAAVRGQAMLALAGDGEWGRVLSVVTAPGPGRDEFAANRMVLSIRGPVPADMAPKFVAFKVIGFSNTTAAVHVVTESGTPTHRYAYPVALAWIDDWRIVLPTTAEAVDAIELPTLDGYTRLEG